MALLFAPHTVTIYETIETPDATTKVVPVPSESSGVQLLAYVEPVRQSVLVDAMTGVELMNPYRLNLEPEDRLSAPYGARVVWEDTEMEFRVTKKSNLYDAGIDFEEVSYAMAEMEQLEVTGL